jgi:hypothetical protein
VTDAFAALADCEATLTDGEELLYRQVTEYNWDAQSNTPATQAFGPSPIDKGMASYSRSSVVSAEESRTWHNENASSHSMSVWGVSVQEVIDQQTRAVDDSGCPGDHSPGHCYVDFRHLAKKDERKFRGMLLARALARGEIAS